jgi:hypothetical protein
LLSVERTESKKQTAYVKYHKNNKALTSINIYAILLAEFQVLGFKFFARRAELFCLVGVSATRQN